MEKSQAGHMPGLKLYLDVYIAARSEPLVQHRPKERQPPDVVSAAELIEPIPVYGNASHLASSRDVGNDKDAVLRVHAIINRVVEAEQLPTARSAPLNQSLTGRLLPTLPADYTPNSGSCLW